MPAKIDLTGQKFNRLTVIKDTGKRNSRGCVIWLCQCDCGNMTEVNGTSLKNNHTRSCGCLMRETAAEIGHKNTINLIGQKFGLLTVLEQVDNNLNTGRVRWKCQCDCGNFVDADGKNLKGGNIQSCGCIKSLGEQKITRILQQAKIPFEREKTFENCIGIKNHKYRFDFYVDNKYIIEYDGRQHFQNYSWGKNQYTLQETQEKDNYKNNYCFIHNIPIIRIPYTHYQKIELKDLLLETSTFLIKQGE